MFNSNLRRDFLLLFCSFLFYFSFLTLNSSVEGSENQTFNDYDTPPELCNPKYENRLYRDDTGHTSIRCVKIGIPEIETYDKSCEELEFTNKENLEECIE